MKTSSYAVDIEKPMSTSPQDLVFFVDLWTSKKQCPQRNMLNCNTMRTCGLVDIVSGYRNFLKGYENENQS
jgi:hypothetical protein